MPITVTLQSDRLPGVQFAGVPLLGAGIPVEITLEQKESILTQLSTFDPPLKNSITLNFGGESDGFVDVPAPTPAPTESPEGGAPAVIPELEQLTELSDDDSDLVDIEISKLLGKTIQEAEPVLIATGGNPDLPVLLRKTYLQRIITHDDLQKGLKAIAEKMLEQL